MIAQPQVKMPKPVIVRNNSDKTRINQTSKTNELKVGYV